jgi:dUTP pyrophosphatase
MMLEKYYHISIKEIKNMKINDVVVNFKKLHKDAVLPQYSTTDSAGLDCVATDGPIIKDTYVGYKLGFAMEIPKGYVGLLFPRSSVSKTDLSMANSVGVIDSDYRGEVEARFKPTHFDYMNNSINTRGDYRYYTGDKVCQLIIVPIPTIKPMWSDELSDTNRGDGGFGSTGK